MATVMNRHPRSTVSANRTTVQKVCIGMGYVFVLIGILGVISPGLMGMHLSLSHNLIHVLSGAISLWVGYSDEWKKSYNFCVIFGVVYGLLGIAGFVFGEPAYPSVGNMEANENLFRVIPNVLEFGTMDHVVHILISFVFLATAYFWKRSHNVGTRSIVDIQRRRDTTNLGRGGDVFRSDKNVPNSQSNLKDANLGKSDIDSRIDRQRRSDFERRV